MMPILYRYIDMTIRLLIFWLVLLREKMPPLIRGCLTYDKNDENEFYPCLNIYLRMIMRMLMRVPMRTIIGMMRMGSVIHRLVPLLEYVSAELLTLNARPSFAF